MSKFKVEFTLKQHTPIIHFQSEQKGATLRATELKPKFDRFLINYVFKNDKNLFEKYLIDKEKNALDYKVKIFNTSVSKHFTYKTYIPKKDKNNKNFREGSYFGDNESIEVYQLKVELFTFHKKLKQIIEDNFDIFISVSSFGTRNNKGFGNFTPVKMTRQDFELNLDKYFIKLKTLKSDNPLKQISTFYQKLKSGGRNGLKSDLMKYFLEDNIRWEKRWIKRQLHDKNKSVFDDLKDEYHDGNFDFQKDETYMFVRALFGLSENNEFLVKSNDKDKLIVKIENIDIKDDKIIVERFPSPIIFKVFEKNIYILLNKEKSFNNKILNKKFKFTAYYKTQPQKKFELGVLTTPKKFDIITCLQDIFDATK